MLDVGQGLAVVVQTASKTLLYDSGPLYSAESDAGQRIVVPYLRAIGVSALDAMVITHSDTDHSGGAASVMTAMPVGRLLSSIPELPGDACTDGQAWEWEGVRFRMLHPQAPGRRGTPGQTESSVPRPAHRGRRQGHAADVGYRGDRRADHAGERCRGGAGRYPAGAASRQPHVFHARVRGGGRRPTWSIRSAIATASDIRVRTWWPAMATHASGAPTGTGRSPLNSVVMCLRLPGARPIAATGTAADAVRARLFVSASGASSMSLFSRLFGQSAAVPSRRVCARCSAPAAGAAPDALHRMGRSIESTRAGVRAWPDAQRSRFRCAGGGAMSAHYRVVCPDIAGRGAAIGSPIRPVMASRSTLPT